MKFYYFIDKERVRQGPLPIEDLQSYEITPNTLVWCKGMKKWSKANDVEELAHLFESINNKNESDITSKKCIECGCEVSDGASACPNCGCPIENVTLCSECNQLIPDGVETCPNCGYPLMKEKEGGEPKEAVEEIKSVYNEEDEDNYRKWLYGIIALLVILITGGGYWWYSHSKGDQEVRQFVEQFAKAVETGDNKAIRNLYPNCNADSLEFKYDKNNIQIERKENEWIVSIAEDKEIFIAKNAENKLYAKDSRGLFVYPDSLFLIAKRTGWYDTSLTDKQNSERLMDTDFISWLNNRVKKEFQSNIKITKATSTKGPEHEPEGIPITSGETDCTVIVYNDNDFDLSGNEYRVKAQEKWMDWSNWDTPTINGKEVPNQGEVKYLSGKPIPAKDSVTFSWKGSGYYESAHSGLIDFKLDANIVFSPHFEKSNLEAYLFSGKEFEEYLAEKKKR